MRFKPGQSGNPAGRPPGSRNKRTIATEKLLGIRTVSLTAVKKRGPQLFYERDGRVVRIERIYNRVIFDELERRPDLRVPFRLQGVADGELTPAQASRLSMKVKRAPRAGAPALMQSRPAPQEIGDRGGAKPNGGP